MEGGTKARTQAMDVDKRQSARVKKAPTVYKVATDAVKRKKAEPPLQKQIDELTKRYVNTSDPKYVPDIINKYNEYIDVLESLLSAAISDRNRYVALDGLKGNQTVHMVPVVGEHDVDALSNMFFTHQRLQGGGPGACCSGGSACKLKNCKKHSKK